ncbi:MAG: phosphate ABC transporter substrate-binding protein [Clostridia bacterium]|nr:phosphate ABC transporter substrate-binding protein [Clostridia bacterium]
MKKTLAMVLALAAVGGMVSFTGCGKEKTTVTISGSTSVQPLMEELASAYEEAHGGISIEVNGGGSGVGISDALLGKNDFGMSSRELKPTEVGLTARRLATDGIALVVNQACAIDGVTADEVYNLYANGVPIGSITAGIAREASSGTRGAFDELVKNSEGKDLTELEAFADGTQTQNSTGNVLTQIATKGNTNLLGYVSLGSLDETVKALKYDGVEPTVQNIEAGIYRLSRPFNLVVKSGKTLSREAQAFFDYLFTDEAQEIVESKGYIRVS